MKDICEKIQDLPNQFVKINKSFSWIISEELPTTLYGFYINREKFW